MGRQKATPQKNASSSSLENLNCYDYIPVFKKRKVQKNKTSIGFNFNVTCVRDKNRCFHLGSIVIGTSKNVLPNTVHKYKVILKDVEEESYTILLECDTTHVIVQPIIGIDLLKEFLTYKIYAFKFYSENEEIHAEVYFLTVPLEKFNKRIGNSVKTALKLFFNIENDTAQDEECKRQLQGNKEIINLYSKLLSVREKHLPKTEENAQHPFLKPTLRPYQIQAVQWMLHRERDPIIPPGSAHPLYMPVVLKSGTTIYFDKYTGFLSLEQPLIETAHRGGILADEMGLGKTVEVLACILLNTKNKTPINCVNKASPVIERQKKKRQVRYEDGSPVKKPKRVIEPVKGNRTILRATLEKWYQETLSQISTVSTKKTDNSIEGPVVQCICGSTSEDNIIECESCGKYQHPYCLGYKKKYEQYLCPQCWMEEPLIECRATLIVTPVALKTQWCKEITKHIKGNLKVLLYEGNAMVPVYPKQLLQYDIVITTYNVLQNELRLTETIQLMNFRNSKKYSPPTTPLTRVRWWRVCLDEAQTVDTPGKMVSEMVSKIEAHYRWAVTGTPISKNISDLHGLLDYLQLSPYNNLDTWTYILFKPYLNENEEPLVNFLSKILWRTSKNDVLNQINIPPQTVREYALEFSAVEKYFYSKQHEVCSDNFLTKVSEYDLSIALQEMDKTNFNLIMAPLLSLRLACSCPSMSRGRYFSTKKPATSMKALLEALIAKNVTESEDNLRALISSLNGLAGVNLILQNPQKSIDCYRQVLQQAARFSGDNCSTKLTVDKLQLVHTMHNLADILDSYPPAQPTLRDSTLRQDCAELEIQYLNKFINETTSTYNSFLSFYNTVNDLEEKFVLKPGQWYSDGLGWIYLNDYFEELVTKVITACDNADVNFALRSRSERQLLQTVHLWEKCITEYRSELLQSISNLYETDPVSEKILVKKHLVQKVMDCHLRPQKTADKVVKCPFCITDEKLKLYEGKLFNMSQRKKIFEEMSLMGSWKPTQEEIIFKSLLAVLKMKNYDDKFIQDGETYVKLIDVFKKEFKECRKFWTYLDKQVCAQDELDICKIKYQLSESNNTKKNATPKELKHLSYTIDNKNENINFLSIYDLDIKKCTFESEVYNSNAKLEKCLGTQSYLETLRKQQYESQTPDPCPICKNALEIHWCILLCGHCYCLDCIQILMEKSFNMYIQCSICRNKHHSKEISYIKVEGTDKCDSDTQLVGNYSTKVGAVIKLILQLRSTEPNVKCLVFSTWIEMLKLLKTALQENSVSCELCYRTNFQTGIESFKDPTKKITTLLLPINLGSKGLNLIEATHVILMEPLLNPVDELQAVGRIHRIGQTKPTTVHKFIIKHTIEESIHKATMSDADNWDKNKVTLQNLVNLFRNENEMITNTNNVPEESILANTSNVPDTIAEIPQCSTSSSGQVS